MSTELTFDDAEDIDLAADAAAEAQQGPTDDQLRGIAGTVETLTALRARMAKAEEWMKQAKAQVEEIETSTLPELMDACGLESFKLTDGSIIEIKKIVAGSIPAKNREDAFAWLRAQGHDFLIKSEVKVALGKGMDSLAASVVDTLQGMGLEVERKETVHAQTLGGWAREMIAEGVTLPLDLLGIYVGKRATVKQSR